MRGVLTTAAPNGNAFRLSSGSGKRALAGWDNGNASGFGGGTLKLQVSFGDDGAASPADKWIDLTGVSLTSQGVVLFDTFGPAKFRAVLTGATAGEIVYAVSE